MQGPFDLEKLQLMVRRGQLGRMHELSRDGATWSRAAEFPEIFEAAKAVAQAKLNESRRFETVSPAASAAPQTPNPATEGPWYYAVAGKECGPLEFPALRELAARGDIRPDTLVWTPRLTSWMPVGEVSGLDLFPAAGRAGDTSNKLGESISVSTGSSDTEIGDLAENLSRAATRSRVWTILIAVVLILMAAVSALRSLLLVGLGIGRGEAGLAVYGLMSFVSAIVLVIGGALLINYSRHLGRVKRTRSILALETALRALHGFWAFAGVMALFGFLIFLILAAVSTFFAFAATAD